jgi:hypothetical protein
MINDFRKFEEELGEENEIDVVYQRFSLDRFVDLQINLRKGKDEYIW